MASCRCQGVKAEALAENATSTATVTANELRQPKSLHALLDMPSHMDLCQIELIYRAEGNANLVLALPQFKKVLRLPKMHSNNEEAASATAGAQVSSTSATAAGTKLPQRVGVVTMQDFMAYIEIIRRLLGNEFVYEADIIAIPKASDRLWINEHIRAARPVTRLDKEFCGQFGLLLPDATQLPDTFDVLLSNLQATATGDVYAIEIKPKQGWLLLSSDVDNSFDLMPTTSDEGATATAIATVKTVKLITSSAEAKTETFPLSVISEERRRRPTTTTTRQQQTDTTAAISTTQSPSSTTGQVPQAECRCRYCAMQFLKLSMGKVNSRSSYCPMDLFSGVPSRMFRALDALFVCPQNNLRIFRNGNLIYGDHAKSISWAELNSNVFQADIMVLIKHLLVTCLLREYDDSVGKAIGAETATTTTTMSPIAMTEQSKMKGTDKVAVEVEAAESGIVAVAEAEANVAKGVVVVVDKAVVGQPSDSSAFASQAQRTMATTTPTATPTATMTTTTIAEIKTETEATATQAQINKAETLCLPKNCVLQKILHFQLLAKQNFRFMWQTGYASKSATSYHALHTLLAKPTPVHSSESLTPVEQYLLGATALDCSIMMTFQEIKMPAERAQAAPTTPWLVHLPAHNRYYMTKVTLLDLDPKPDSHFYKYIKQTQAIAKLRT